MQKYEYWIQAYSIDIVDTFVMVTLKKLHFISRCGSKIGFSLMINSGRFVLWVAAGMVGKGEGATMIHFSKRILPKELFFALLVKGERGVIHYCKRASKASKTK